MKTMRHNRTTFRLAALLLAAFTICAAAAQAAAPTRIAPILQPFVDSHTLAGAVTLVASKDKVLNLEAVGWMDIGAKKRMRTDCLF